MTNAPREALITVTGGAFGYHGTAIVSGVNVALAPGEFTGLIGPNGAGKSTLFKGLLKLIAPLSGEVHHAPRLAGRIGYVPQRDTLDPIYPLTAADVVDMGGRAGRTEECLAQVGMREFRARTFSELSGGQRQRVLIARALAVDPELLVLDEPTAGIDPVAEESVLQLLSDLHRRQKLTILMVSHHMPALRRCAERVIAVNRGRIQSGPAAELLAPERIIELLEGAL